MASVVLVVGKGRSGSTLLDQLLGGTAGWFSAGELARLWDWGVRDRVACACGASIPECPVWSAVIADVGLSSADVAEVLRWRRAAMSWPSAPRLLIGRPAPGAREWADLMERTYAAIRAVTAADVVVDSSKWPVNPALFGMVGGTTVHAVHLVRDPRAVAHSWRRHRRFRDRDADMPRYSAASTSLSWDARHLAALATRRRGRATSWTTIRYEDLTADPSRWLRAIHEVCDPGGGRAPDRCGPGVLHTIGGNPSKSAGRGIEVAADEEWRHRLGRRDRWVTTALCAPLLGRFGYPFRS